MADQANQQQTTQQQQDQGLAPRGIPWPQAFEEVKSERDAIKARVREMDAELSKYRQAEDARKAEQAKADEQNQRKILEEQGKYREALQQTEEKWKQQLNGYKQVVSSKLLPLAIQNAASQIPNLTKEAVRDLPMLLRDALAVDEQTLEVYVRGEDGKPLMDEKLNQVQVASYLQRFVQERPYLLVDGMPTRHGQSSGQAKSAWTFEQAMADKSLAEEWQKSDPEGFKRAEQAYFSPQATRARFLAGQKK